MGAGRRMAALVIAFLWLGIAGPAMAEKAGKTSAEVGQVERCWS